MEGKMTLIIGLLLFSVLMSFFVDLMEAIVYGGTAEHG